MSSLKKMENKENPFIVKRLVTSQDDGAYVSITVEQFKRICRSAVQWQKAMNMYKE
jgi:hypothetical protein